MRKLMMVAFATAGVLCSSTAFAQVKQYGRAGTFEVAGNFTLSNTTSDYDDSGETERSETTIAPTVGFYLMDAVELLGDIRITNTSINDTDGSVLAIGAGAGYFIPVGAIRVGPQILFRYYSEEIGDFKDTGPGATVGAAAKVPIGTGGLLITGFNYDYLMTEREANGNKEDGTVSGYAFTVGFGIYF